MNEFPIPPNRPALRLPWKGILLIGVCVLLPLCAVVIYHYRGLAVEDELEQVLAETDRLDPGWRLHELEQRREIIAEQENSALCILRVIELFPADWATLQGAEPQEGVDRVEGSFALNPVEQLSDWETMELRGRLGKLRGALREAHKLAELPSGRYPFDWSTRPWLPPSRSDSAEVVADLLDLDAVLCAQEGRVDDALVCARRMINAARSIGDEPLDLSQIVRKNCRNQAVKTIQRALAQGLASQGALRAVQVLLQEEECETLLLTIARAERARWHESLEALKAGRLRFQEASGMPLESSVETIQRTMLPHSYAWIMRHMNKYVEVAKGPMQEWDHQLQELQASVAEAPAVAKPFIAPLTQHAQTAAYVKRSHALLRCAIGAIAAERYRLANGRWPETLEALTPQYLPQVPTDPYGRGSIRLDQTEDGIVFSSEPNAGRTHRDLKPAKFRLWNVQQRRQPSKKVQGK